MNFVDFNIHWYKDRLEYYSRLDSENSINKNIVHEAKILYKFLEDIYDEGYKSTYDLFQNELQATQKLVSFIKSNNEIHLLFKKNYISMKN